MAHFYGTVSTGRGTSASRTGSKDTGLVVDAMGWTGRIEVHLRHDKENGHDHYRIVQTPHPKSDNGVRELVAEGILGCRVEDQPGGDARALRIIREHVPEATFEDVRKLRSIFRDAAAETDRRNKLYEIRIALEGYKDKSIKATRALDRIAAAVGEDGVCFGGTLPERVVPAADVDPTEEVQDLLLKRALKHLRTHRANISDRFGERSVPETLTALIRDIERVTEG